MLYDNSRGAAPGPQVGGDEEAKDNSEEQSEEEGGRGGLRNGDTRLMASNFRNIVPSCLRSMTEGVNCNPPSALRRSTGKGLLNSPALRMAC